MTSVGGGRIDDTRRLVRLDVFISGANKSRARAWVFVDGKSSQACYRKENHVGWFKAVITNMLGDMDDVEGSIF